MCLNGGVLGEKLVGIIKWAMTKICNHKHVD